MSLIYITGTPGAGKTTIYKELLKLGCVAYDIDSPRFGGPVNLATRQSVVMPLAKERSPEWFDEHEWRVSRAAVQELVKEAKDKVVYLCGTTTTESLVWDLFDKILYLNVGEDSLRYRIAHRVGNDFGQTEDELQIILERYKVAQSKLNTLDVTIIDTEISIEDTVNNILSES